MKYQILSISLLFFVRGFLFGQEFPVTKLFLEEAPLDIRLSIGVKDVKGIKSDTVYTSSILFYKFGDQQSWDSIKIEVRARGDFRRKECFYPPLRIKIKKGDAKGTLFEGNKSLKLVMPCRQVRDNSLIMKEYICYQMLEPVTNFTFNTRLVNVEFNDDNNKRSKAAQFMGFLIEDDDVVAKRHGGKVVEDLNLHPKALEDTNALRHDMFQYMIANTDWSTTFLHNAKLIQLTESRKFIPLTYDFDMAGFVDAPYAVVDVTLGITSVRDRLYRGFCRTDAITQTVRKEFISKESAIMAAISKYESSFTPREFSAIVKYMDEFFTTFKSDAKFKSSIVEKCRTR